MKTVHERKASLILTSKLDHGAWSTSQSCHLHFTYVRNQTLAIQSRKVQLSLYLT